MKTHSGLTKGKRSKKQVCEEIEKIIVTGRSNVFTKSRSSLFKTNRNDLQDEQIFNTTLVELLE